MIYIKKNYQLFIILFGFWVLLTESISPINVIVGLVASTITTIASKGILYDDGGFFFNFPKVSVMIRYFFKLLVEIYKSSFSHIIRIIKRDCDPVIVEVKLDVSDVFITTVISNSITLTPGTITVDVNGNRLTVLSIKDYGENGDRVTKNIKENFEKFFIERG